MIFASFHPAVCFLYMTAVLIWTAVIHHPVYVGISLLAALVCSHMLYGCRAVKWNLPAFVIGAVWSFWYSSFHHFGMTVLGYGLIGNAVTLESVLYAVTIGTIIAVELIWLSVMQELIQTDAVVYLFGCISPKLGLFLARLFRMIPRVRKQAGRMRSGRGGIGMAKSTSGDGITQETRSRLREWSMLPAWTAENLLDASESMRARGYGECSRTAYARYRFDHRDRSIVLILAGCAVLVQTGAALDQMTIHFDPQIILNRLTPLSSVFLTAYAVFLFWPVFTEAFYSWTNKRSAV